MPLPVINVKRFSRAKFDIDTGKEIETPQQLDIKNNNVEESIVDDNSARDEEIEQEQEQDDFLNEFNNDVFVSESVIKEQEKMREKEEKELDKKMKKQDKEIKRIEKLQKDKEKQEKQVEKQMKENEKMKQRQLDDELFSEKGTELFGRDRLELIARIKQFKILFPDNEQIKKLKIKKNPSIEDLHNILAECQAIVDTDCIEAFMTDSLLQCVKMVEFGSTKTKYNISGLAEMLKSNPQFNSLCKQLFIKYKVFSKVPPEYQMVLLVSTTAYICLEKNKKEESNKNLLNKPIPMNF